MQVLLTEVQHELDSKKNNMRCEDRNNLLFVEQRRSVQF